MSESAPTAAAGPVTAGRLLREARQAQGLHIAALASAIKVAPRKLELLEADRLEELPDATFSRALAQTVCRSLKVDAAPIMALLPRATAGRLEAVGEGLNTPFHERPGRLVPNDWMNFARPQFWGPVLLVLAAAAIYLMPPGWLPGGALRGRSGEGTASGTDGGASGASSSPASALVAPQAAAVSPATTSDVAALPLAATAALAPAVPTAAAASASARGATPGVAMAEPARLLQLHAAGDSWIEVADAQGRTLFSRLLRSGETVGLDGAVPLRVRIGNASKTDVVFRGQPFELTPFTRDNLARLELK